MVKRPHRLLSIRISSFVAVLAIVALGLGIAVLRNGGSASTGQNADRSAAVSTPARTVSSSSSAEQLYSSTHQGVVKITTGTGLGTGIVLDKQGDILTND